MARSWEIAHLGSPMALVVGKIDKCQENLKKWSKNSVCNISRSLMEKKKMLGKGEVAAIQGGSVDFFLQLKSEVNDLLRMEKQIDRKSVV